MLRKSTVLIGRIRLTAAWIASGGVIGAARPKVGTISSRDLWSGLEPATRLGSGLGAARPIDAFKESSESEFLSPLEKERSQEVVKRSR